MRPIAVAVAAPKRGAESSAPPAEPWREQTEDWAVSRGIGGGGAVASFGAPAAATYRTPSFHGSAESAPLSVPRA